MTRLTSWLTRWTLRAAMRVYAFVLAGLDRGPQRRGGSEEPPLRERPPAGRQQSMLLTLNFHAAGWPRAVFGPLVMSRHLADLHLVTTVPVTGLAGVRVTHPPAWLRTIAGATIARLLTFAVIAWRTRPDIVGGVHLLFNGLVARVVAAATGARSLYICVGGPNELVGGGAASENRMFRRIARPDAVLEQRLVAAARSFDDIVTMGSRAAAFFEARGARGRVSIVPGGIDAVVYHPGGELRDVDLIMVARLVGLKRLDLFIETVQRLSMRDPSIKAVVIGSGPTRAAGEALVARLGLERHVTFLGHAPDVGVWLRRARVFLLPSDTEGVSIAVIEAMLSGAVPVVSNVGDLADAVHHGVDGLLVDRRTPDGFAEAVDALLSDAERWGAMSAAARRSAVAFTPPHLAARWDDVLEGREARPSSAGHLARASAS